MDFDFENLVHIISVKFVSLDNISHIKVMGDIAVSLFLLRQKIPLTIQSIGE